VIVGVSEPSGVPGVFYPVEGRSHSPPGDRHHRRRCPAPLPRAGTRLTQSALEELVAEIGAAFLCADLGITPETRDDHAAHIASWLNVLKDDKLIDSSRGLRPLTSSQSGSG
jgi:hypothetical protein